ncbi:MAG: hypothetical protein K2X82_32725 [Gemmataceae bacterium]|nr:hypothetical protein [Gemmataceae bacterium]
MGERPRDRVIHTFVDAELDRLAAVAGEQPAGATCSASNLARVWADLP